MLVHTSISPLTHSDSLTCGLVFHADQYSDNKYSYEDKEDHHGNSYRTLPPVCEECDVHLLTPTTTPRPAACWSPGTSSTTSPPSTGRRAPCQDSMPHYCPDRASIWPNPYFCVVTIINLPISPFIFFYFHLCVTYYIVLGCVLLLFLFYHHHHPFL